MFLRPSSPKLKIPDGTTEGPWQFTKGVGLACVERVNRFPQIRAYLKLSVRVPQSYGYTSNIHFDWAATSSLGNSQCGWAK
jgi:hypothetical protein